MLLLNESEARHVAQQVGELVTRNLPALHRKLRMSGHHFELTQESFDVKFVDDMRKSSLR